MSAVSERLLPSLRAGGRLGAPRRSWLTVVVLGVVAVALAAVCHAHHPQALPRVLLIGLGCVVLFGICGDALAVGLCPADWRAVRPLLAQAFGVAASGMVLMAFGVAHVPLHVSLWVTLALGLAASWAVRRRIGRGAGAAVAGSSAVARFGAARSRGAGWSQERWIWTCVLAIVFLVALIPAWRLGDLTIYGENPDSSQVVGIAVLFQHVPPTHYDIALPLDIVPSEWRFRYPIFYPLAAVASLVHADPIRIFSVMEALLLVLCALGWGLCAVRCFRAPAWAGPVVAAMIGFTWILQYLVWHPYWNQLWGTALMPYTILFGWQAIKPSTGRAGGWDGRGAVACLVFLLMLWFAYPLALPYPLVILAGVLVAYWRRPRRPSFSSWRGWLAGIVVLCLLIPAVAGSVIKLKQAIVQLVSPHSALWGGDVKTYISPGTFAGSGGGVVAAVLVLAAAAYGLWRLDDRRLRICLGVVLAALLLLDLRFRLSASGTYMDFKHLDFMGLILLTLAASGLLRRAQEPGAWRWLAAVALVAWCGAALRIDRRDALHQGDQVTPQMFQIRQWAARIPAAASVRIDIPPDEGGLALWAVYMLGSHPVDSFEPITDTTYATPQPGFRADYAISLSVYPGTKVPFPQVRFTKDPPVFENSQFVLRRVDWPRYADNVPQTASQILTEP